MLLGESGGEDAPAERRGFWGSRGGEEAKAALVSRGRSPWLSGGVSSQASRGTLWDTVGHCGTLGGGAAWVLGAGRGAKRSASNLHILRYLLDIQGEMSIRI